MATIHVEISDWLYNAGIVGLTNILEHAGEEVIKKGNYIEFDAEALKGFGEKYFEYLVYRYEKFTTWHKIVSEREYFRNLTAMTLTEPMLEGINSKVEYIKSKCSSDSYKSAYILSGDNSFDVERYLKRLGKVKLKKNQVILDRWTEIEAIANAYSEIVDYLEKDKVKRYILGKNMMYDVVQNFWQGVNFLHKLASIKDMYLVATQEFVEPIEQYLKENHSKDKYNCIQCNQTVGKLSKPEAFDLTWLTKIGVDMSRKTSHFWDYTVDAYICPICHLVYGCIPAGFTVLKSQGIFINENNNIQRLIAINALTLNKDKSLDDLEQENYYNLVNIMQDEENQTARKQISNIQIIKYNSQNKRRPYTFNMLSKEKLDILTKAHKNLSKLLNISIKVEKDEYINVYYEVIKNICENKNQFGLIAKLMNLLLNNKTKRAYLIKEILIINNNFLGGIGKMVNYKQIEESRLKGLQLHKLYEAKNAGNKITGISHKLLNALKTKNASRFTETLLHAYMYLGGGIPQVFLEALKDEDKLQTIGYAFMLGLQGETIDKKGGNNNE